MNFAELVYWNNKSYGQAIRIKRGVLIVGLIVFCLVTPLTNWLIPLSHRIIRGDLVYRFGR